LLAGPEGRGKYEMMAARIVFLMIFIAAAVLALTAPAEEKTYTFIIPIQAGLAETSLDKVLDEVSVTLGEVTGIRLKSLKPSYEIGANATEIVMKAFKENTAQIGYVNGIEYACHLENNPKSDIFRPEFTLVMDKKKYAEVCMYVSKDSKVDSVAKTRGLKWGGSDTGEIDVFVAVKAHLKMGGSVAGATEKGKSAGIIPFRELFCAPYENNWIFGYRKDVPLEVSGKITNTLLGARKIKAFDKYKFLFMAIDGGFAPFKFDEDFERSKKIAKLRDSAGWSAENQAFLKKFKPPS